DDRRQQRLRHHRLSRFVGCRAARHDYPASSRAARRAFSGREKNGTVMTMDESDMPEPEVRITSRLVDSLYTEAMLLADEARSYFDDAGRDERSTLEPFARVGFACES